MLTRLGDDGVRDWALAEATGVLFSRPLFGKTRKWHIDGPYMVTFTLPEAMQYVAARTEGANR